MAARNDDGLYAQASSLFISKATMDDLTGRATPRQTDAASRPFDTEPANGERSKRERLLRLRQVPRRQKPGRLRLLEREAPGRVRARRSAGPGLRALRAGPGVLRQDRQGQDLPRDRPGHEGRGTGPERAVPPDRGARAPARQGQTRREPRRDARGHRQGRPDHLGRVRLRAVRHRRGAPAPTGSSRAATRGGASRPPRTSGPANGARSSRTTSSRPRSSTGSCIMDACSSSPGRATASARRSCSEGRPPDPRPNPRRRQRNRPERSLAKIEIFS